MRLATEGRAVPFINAVARMTRGRMAVAVAFALFAAIFAIRLVVRAPGDGIAFLYAVPIAILSIEFGAAAGVAAAASAFALVCVWALTMGAALGAVGYLTRAVIFAGVGWLVSRLAAQRRQLEEENLRWFETSNAILGVASFDGYFTQVNAAWEKCLGFTGQEIMSRPFVELVHPDDLDGTIAAAGSLAAGPSGVVDFENRYMTKSGDWRCIRWNASSDDKHIYAVGIDVTDRKEAEAQRDVLLARVEAIARTDDLTGLPNRRAWDEELRRELSRAARSGQPLGLIMLDVDRFKRYNDRHGHQAGDALLQEAALAWRMAIRDSDFIARYGGEEFAVLLPDTGTNGALGVVERLREAVPARQTCSAGLAVWDGSESPDDLVARADGALYEAKHAGRNCTINAA